MSSRNKLLIRKTDLGKSCSSLSIHLQFVKDNSPKFGILVELKKKAIQKGLVYQSSIRI